jgi:hypothetical protein
MPLSLIVVVFTLALIRARTADRPLRTSEVDAEVPGLLGRKGTTGDVEK